MPRGPRKMLLGDEGNSALHYFDLDDPGQNWTYQGPGRDLQLIGNGRVCAAARKGSSSSISPTAERSYAT